MGAGNLAAGRQTPRRVIDHSRGHQPLTELEGDYNSGTLIHEGWAVYDRFEVPPAALGDVIGQSVDAPAFRAVDVGGDVDQADFNAALGELEINGLDSPGLVNSALRQSGICMPVDPAGASVPQTLQ